MLYYRCPDSKVRINRRPSGVGFRKVWNPAKNSQLKRIDISFRDILLIKFG